MNKPRETPSRLIYQFSGDVIHRTSYSYEKTYSSNEPLYHIFLKRTDFRNPDHQFVGMRINNLSPYKIPLVMQFIYDEFVPKVPTATTPAATWKTSYIAGVAAGYGLLTLALFSTVFLIIVFCFKLKELKMLQKVTNAIDE